MEREKEDGKIGEEEKIMEYSLRIFYHLHTCIDVPVGPRQGYILGLDFLPRPNILQFYDSLKTPELNIIRRSTDYQALKLSCQLLNVTKAFEGKKCSGNTVLAIKIKIYMHVCL